MPLPLIIGAAFAIWAIIDVGLLATTGDDSIGHIAGILGWTGTVQADNVIIEMGMTALDFVIGFWFLITLFLAVIFLTFWFSTRPLKPKTKKVKV